ncbi:MAG: hypothetical protein MK081_11080 [Flavobacteriales bacterium]|nr:hypothetical protein [Flavobacteriales bacterium]
MAYLFMGYGVDRSNFFEVFVGFGFLFGGMIIFMRRKHEMGWKEIFWIALLFRSAFIFSEPRLSDDYYRFTWDGLLTVQGENPYLILPQDFISDERAAEWQLDGLYDGLNSKQYYTVYPPVNQMIFAASVWLGQGSLAGAVFFLHLFILLGEALLLFLIARLLSYFELPYWWSIGYALNPLVIVELSGNVHFEGMVMSFLALSVWLACCFRYRGTAMPFLGGIPFALAVSVKLTPLMLVPLVFVILKRRAFGFGAIALFTLVLTFLPFYSSELIAHWQTSIELYFKSFEFNASIYYLVRAIGEAILGYNPIQTLGPWMSLFTLSLILLVAFSRWNNKGTRKEQVVRYGTALTLTYLVYYAMTTTVHPWYITMISAAAVFSNRKAIWFWSFLAVFSYAHYDGGGFQENYFWIIAEYVILAAALLAPLPIKEAFSKKVLNGWRE